MAPLPNTVLKLLTRSLSSSLESDSQATPGDVAAELLSRSPSSPSFKASHLISRAQTSTNTYVPCAGCKSPESFNNQVYFAFFAILGVAMVLASMWFFFWSKNGGFKWQEGDWDDYKSTVLRKKGPDGRTIVSGTRSTKYSGQSIADRQAKWAAKSVIARDEKGRKGILAQRGFGGTHSAYYRDNFTDFGEDRTEDMSEVATQAPRHYESRPQVGGHHAQRYRDRDLKQYRHERVARVGGINREADGSHFGSETMTETSSDTHARRQKKKRSHKTDHSTHTTSAEKKARHDAAAMERQWKKDADRAAAEVARERPIEMKPTPTPKARTPSPTKKPAGARRESRASSPQKRGRDFSYTQGDDGTSAGYTTTSAGQSSYYDAYRPHATGGRQSSPVKGGSGGGGRDVMAGYRRGMSDI